MDGHFGAYLLGHKDWSLVQNIGRYFLSSMLWHNERKVSSMSASFMVPVSTKIRLCQPVQKTIEFAQRLEASGSSWVTLHARTVSARRRRQGAADLAQVKLLKGGLRIPVVSNGNVRTFHDLGANSDFTRADGLMVGETLLGNPWSSTLLSLLL